MKSRWQSAAVNHSGRHVFLCSVRRGPPNGPPSVTDFAVIDSGSRRRRQRRTSQPRFGRSAVKADAAAVTFERSAKNNKPKKTKQRLQPQIAGCRRSDKYGKENVLLLYSTVAKVHDVLRVISAWPTTGNTSKWRRDGYSSVRMLFMKAQGSCKRCGFSMANTFRYEKQNAQ